MGVSDKKWRVAGGLATVYVIWGTTYLAIRFVVASIPPFLAAASRFLLVAAVLVTLAALVFRQRVRRGDGWRITVSGILMMGLGNGLVMWAEQRVPSGVAALWIASSPIFVMLLNWWAFAKAKPKPMALAGAVVGAVGIACLPGATAGGNPWDVAALLGACLFWTVGALMQSAGRLATPLLLVTGLQSLVGGLFLVALGGVAGEWGAFSWQAITPTAGVSLLYLAVFGSLVAFTVYTWLLRNAEPHVVSTYTLVNPLIAVMAGAAFAQENLSAPIFIAALCIILGVAMILVAKKTRATPELAPAPASE